MDSEHFKKIFLPYHGKLYRVAFRLLGNRADAEDMVQETYIKLWKKRLELESLVNPESFAVTLLKNGFLDVLRKVKPDAIPLDALQAAGPESLSGQIERREQLQHVRVIMERLPARQKEVVELKIWDDLSDEEIARRTGLTRGNIKVILSRARRTIKEQYLKWERNERRV